MKKEKKKVEEKVEVKTEVVEETQTTEPVTESVKEKKKVNLPNILTLVRIALVPVFVVLLALDGVWEYMRYIALGVFVIASVTDWVDGFIARKFNMVIIS